MNHSTKCVTGRASVEPVAGASSEPDVDRPRGIPVGTRRRLIARSVVAALAWVAAIVTAYYVLPWSGGGTGSVVVRVVLAVSLVIVVTVVAVPSVRRDPFPVMRALQLLAVVVSLAVVSFASVYLLMSANRPDAFSEPLGRTDALYFSLTTVTTVGYGDINAKSEAARIVVMIHMVTNVVVVGAAARAIINAAQRRVGDR